MITTVRQSLRHLFGFIFITIITTNVAFAQKQTIRITEKLPLWFSLPGKVNESSGIIWLNGFLWTFNDSGGKNQLYRIEPGNGEIDRTVTVLNAVNVDWEDIAQDNENIYIGDFGNNRGNRKDLSVYMLSKTGIDDPENTNVESGIITFTYADQKSFDSKNRSNNFDCEAIIALDTSLILFSKNWEDQKTRMYHLSGQPGDHLIEPVDSFDVNGLVTGADYWPESSRLLLVGYKNYVPFLYLFSSFDGRGFDCDTILRFDLTSMYRAQTEGVCFIDGDEVAISCEDTKAFDQSVFRVRLKELMDKGTIDD